MTEDGERRTENQGTRITGQVNRIPYGGDQDSRESGEKSPLFCHVEPIRLRSGQALSRRLAADDNCSAFETRSLHFGRDDDKYQASLRLALPASPETMGLRRASRTGQNQEFYPSQWPCYGEWTSIKKRFCLFFSRFLV